jgi:hypothetical protein
MNIKYDKGFFEYVEKAVDKWIGRIEGTTLNSGGSLIKSRVLKEINWTLYDKNMENEKMKKVEGIAKDILILSRNTLLVNLRFH